MFEFDATPAQTGTVSAAELAGWVDRLSRVDATGADAELINRITELERIKSACAAAQAALTLAFVTSQTAGLSAKEQKQEGTHRSIAGQIALARRDSPFRGGRHVGLATALIREMPHTYRALQTGSISEWRATLLVRETACLSAEDRGLVDAELAPRLGSMGDKRTVQAAAMIAQRLDAANCVKRHRKAVGDRRVSIRPAPDTMAYLTALLPVAQGVAVYAALTRHANSSTAVGDTRGRGQIMADELVHRVIGVGNPSIVGVSPPGPESSSHCENQPIADELGDAGTVPAGVNIDIQLVMTDSTLLGRDLEPAVLAGYGPIPADLARRIVRTAPPQAKTFIRRLFTHPGTGQLITADAQRRVFTPVMRQFLSARDQTCRTSWCDAPIRHADHVTSHHQRGPTTIENGQGLCERCNYIKASPGWRAIADKDGIGIITITPTGHTARSDPPLPPRSERQVEVSYLMARLRNAVVAS